MTCPQCESNQIRVVDKRNNKETNTIRRRRECKGCGFRFTTYEKIDKINFLVRKRSGRVEEYNRQKLAKSILKGLKKRNIAQTEIDQFLDKIEIALHNKRKSILESQEIGETVLKLLKDFDEVAYILYATVYLDYDNLDEIQTELTRLIKNSNN